MARLNPDVLEFPAPDVLAVGIGENALKFELRVWSTNQLHTPSVLKSELYFGICGHCGSIRSNSLPLRSARYPVGEQATLLAKYSAEDRYVGSLCDVEYAELSALAWPFEGRDDWPRHRTGDAWHVWVKGIRPGDLYAYRAEGPHKPQKGIVSIHISCLDPFAMTITGDGCGTPWPAFVTSSRSIRQICPTPT